MTFDITIIGGGIVGLSAAWQWQRRYPGMKLLVLEKEAALGYHQTGHNSGVIHAGVYYAPGSLKASLCKQGLRETVRFCKENRIPYEQCGKLLVATGPLESQRLRALYQRCRQNETDCELLDGAALKEREPNIRGTGAIYVRGTGIVDFKKICERLGQLIRDGGGEIRLNTRVFSITENDRELTLKTGSGEIRTAFLICCAGLQADRMVLSHGLDADFRIVPFRGEYYRLPEGKSDLIRHLIYPIPDPALPFLGVHLTRVIDGGITVGPNAVLGWKREGYDRVNFSLADTSGMLVYKGFWKLLGRHLGYGLTEMKNSWWKYGYLRQVRKYCPQLALSDLLPYPAGVRAQAVLVDGTLVHDFHFAESPRSLHVCNAPSPAATSALPIGAYICDRLAAKMS